MNRQNKSLHELLAQFKNATGELSEVWGREDAEIRNYPKYLPSFDEFFQDVLAMEFPTPAKTMEDVMNILSQYPEFDRVSLEHPGQIHMSFTNVNTGRLCLVIAGTVNENWGADIYHSDEDGAYDFAKTDDNVNTRISSKSIHAGAIAQTLLVSMMHASWIHYQPYVAEFPPEFWMPLALRTLPDFSDASWHNDVMPHFERELSDKTVLAVWCDAKEQKDSEHCDDKPESWRRYTLFHDPNEEPIFRTNDPAEMVTFIKGFVSAYERATEGQ